LSAFSKEICARRNDRDRIPGSFEPGSGLGSAQQTTPSPRATGREEL